jgi:UDP-N-acetyl-D-glucosamine dehydrogenase
VKGARVHILGVAYKKDVADIRESPALDVMTLLHHLGARLTYTDPHVASLKIEGQELCSQEALPACRDADCVTLITNHSAFDYARIARESRLIIDTRNAFRDYRTDKVVRL